ncbi:MAG: ABC transporter ATP-binding protein [Candidatus Zixiibacteriota bacterium]
MLRAEKLHKVYQTPTQTLKVLKGIDIDVESGDYIVIMGESGAGKSTLLHLLGFLDKPSSGSVEFAGYNSLKIDETKETEIRLNKIGYLFQRHHLLDDFSTLENVALPMIARGHSHDSSRAAALEILDSIGMSNRAESYPSQLSGGESQRVALARALINDPDILIADEPTGNLDIGNTERLMEYIDTIRKRYDLAIIMATHDLRVAKKADKIYQIEGGVLKNA